MKFSVAIPVYNCERHLPAALECLASQDFADWEAVVVDDGSTDCSAEIADSFARRDGRFRVVRKANGGVSSARNAAMDAMRGEWLLWLDADDLYVPGSLRRIAAAVDSAPGSRCVQFPYLEIVSGGGLLPRIAPVYRDFGGRTWTGREAFRLLFASRSTAGMNWQPWRFAYRRDSLPRFRDGSIHEDIEVLPLHMAGLESVLVSREAFYAYRPAREGAATAAFTPRRVRDILSVTGRVVRDIAASGLDGRSRRGFAGMVAWNLFGYYVAASRFPEPERGELLDAFAEHPEWLLAIDRPLLASFAKRILLRTLGVRRAASAIGRLAK